MNAKFTWGFYGLAGILLTWSLIKDGEKTRAAFRKAWGMMRGVLPQFMAIVLFVGLVLAVLPPQAVQHLMGEEAGLKGMLMCSAIGSATLMPVMVAFPLVAQLLESGAGTAQMAVFVFTLTTVGVMTFPIEAKYLGAKVALLRNGAAYLVSFVAACLMGVVLG